MAEETKAKGAMTDESGDWFGNRETSSNQLPRYGIGDPNANGVDDPDKILMTLEGTYEDSSVEMVKDKLRLIHRIAGRTLVGGSPRIEIWGSAAIDKVMPTLLPGTKVRLTYLGERKIKGQKNPMKDIRLEFPADAKRRPNPFAPKGEQIPF